MAKDRGGSGIQLGNVGQESINRKTALLDKKTSGDVLFQAIPTILLHGARTRSHLGIIRLLGGVNNICQQKTSKTPCASSILLFSCAFHDALN
jgi:hypothetical protein